mmetsp:Transcript_97172/g.278148  ORF Transcript_97172/g.278148 Transcript_97172/m.278148 type:complete len:244 (-) Transcript_97172:368-1099(-)
MIRPLMCSLVAHFNNTALHLSTLLDFSFLADGTELDHQVALLILVELRNTPLAGVTGLDGINRLAVPKVLRRGRRRGRRRSRFGCRGGCHCRCPDFRSGGRLRRLPGLGMRGRGDRRRLGLCCSSRLRREQRNALRLRHGRRRCRTPWKRAPQTTLLAPASGGRGGGRRGGNRRSRGRRLGFAATGCRTAPASASSAFGALRFRLGPIPSLLALARGFRDGHGRGGRPRGGSQFSSSGGRGRR